MFQKLNDNFWRDQKRRLTKENQEKKFQKKTQQIRRTWNTQGNSTTQGWKNKRFTTDKGSVPKDRHKFVKNEYFWAKNQRWRKTGKEIRKEEWDQEQKREKKNECNQKEKTQKRPWRKKIRKHEMVKKKKEKHGDREIKEEWRKERKEKGDKSTKWWTKRCKEKWSKEKSDERWREKRIFKEVSKKKIKIKRIISHTKWFKKSQEKRKRRKEKTERKQKEDVSSICWKNQHLFRYIKARE